MRLPRLRFTVGGLMILVAIVAILTSTVPELARRQEACRIAAANHLVMAGYATARATIYEKAGRWTLATVERRLEAFHADLARKYRWMFLNPIHECVRGEDLN
jgi:hypothetical protein